MKRTGCLIDYRNFLTRLCLTSLVLICYTTSYAQFNLSVRTNLPQPGDSVTKEKVDYVGIYSVGEQTTWDFSGLKTNDLYHIKYDTIDGELIAFDHQKSYRYAVSGDSLLMTGYESQLRSMDYIKPQLYMPYHLSLGETCQAIYKGEGRYSGTHYERVFGTVKTEADAVGTIILSESDTLPNTVCLHSVITESVRLNKDSCLNDSDNLKQIITEHYKWYARGYRYPVFETITSSTYDNLNHVATQQYAYRCPPSIQVALKDSINEEIRLNDYQDRNNVTPKYGDSPSSSTNDSGFTYRIDTNGRLVTITYSLEKTAIIHVLVVDVMGTIHREMQMGNEAGNDYTMQINCTGLRHGQYIIYINVNGTIYHSKIPVK